MPEPTSLPITTFRHLNATLLSPRAFSILLIFLFVSTSNAYTVSTGRKPHRHQRPTLASKIVAGVIVGIILLMALVCLCHVLAERRRRSRSHTRRPSQNPTLTGTQTVHMYSAADPGPGPGFGHEKKNPLLGGKVFGFGKRRGGRSGVALDQEPSAGDVGQQQQQPACSQNLNPDSTGYPPYLGQNLDMAHEHVQQRCASSSHVQVPVPVPDVPPPVYMDCNHDKRSEACQLMKYDLPPGPPPGRNPTEANSDTSMDLNMHPSESDSLPDGGSEMNGGTKGCRWQHHGLPSSAVYA